MQLPVTVKNRGYFPREEPSIKLIYLALRKSEKDWEMELVVCKQAADQFAILFGERFINALH